MNGVMISVSGTMDLDFPAFEKLIDMEKLRAYARPVDINSDVHQMARYLEAWVK